LDCFVSLSERERDLLRFVSASGMANFSLNKGAKMQIWIGVWDQVWDGMGLRWCDLWVFWQTRMWECEGNARMAGWKYYNRATHLKRKNCDNEQTPAVQVRWKAAASCMSLPSTRKHVYPHPKIPLYSIVGSVLASYCQTPLRDACGMLTKRFYI